MHFRVPHIYSFNYNHKCFKKQVWITVLEKSHFVCFLKNFFADVNSRGSFMEVVGSKILNENKP